MPSLFIDPETSQRPDDTDDMQDGRDPAALPGRLGQVLGHIYISLYRTYEDYDSTSRDIQEKHKWSAIIAVTCGAAAIMLAILQVVVRASGIAVDLPIVAAVEIVSFVVAAVAVWGALRIQFLKGWLKERYLAERCRSLKFRALIHPYLLCSSDRSWEDRFLRWKEEFGRRVGGIKRTENVPIETCILTDKVFPPSSETAACSFEVPYITSVAEYYQKRRIAMQLRYFQSRALWFETIDRRTGWIPGLCFTAGIICVGGHFGIDIGQNVTLLPRTEALGLLSEILLLVSLLLPIYGISVRTLRSSMEVSRSAALYYSKARALEHLNTRLEKELTASAIQWAGIIRILCECENFFEIENREWLRMMNEAEWFI